MSARDVMVTWLGHSTFLLQTPEGKTILVDPWLHGNPACPKDRHGVSSDLILITHGHGDHCGDAASAAERCSGPVVAIYELAERLKSKGIEGGRLTGMNKGGTLEVPELKVSVTMTDARHSSAEIGDDGSIVYLGEAAGYVVGFSNGLRLYIAGDTCFFGDMRWIAKLHAPNAAILPIGDLYTMDPKAAAYACAMMNLPVVIPCHWGTFPALTGTPEALRSELKGLGVSTEVLEMKAGGTVAVKGRG